MKTISILIVSAALVVSSSAASYFFNNGASLSASGISDVMGHTFSNSTPAGSAFPSGGGISAGPGVVGIGIFSTDNLEGLDSQSLIADFTSLTGLTNAFAAAGPLGNRGMFAYYAISIPIAGTVFENQNMYLFAGNGTTFSNSTEFLVVKSAAQFLASDDNIPTPITEILRPTGGTAETTLLLGTNVPNVQTTNTDASITPGWAMVTVPEGSTALLGALGALALLRRRR